MTDLRTISLDDFPNLSMTPGADDAGAVPMLMWIPIAHLRVDEGYQREIGRAGQATVRRIADQFTWTRFSPIVVAPIEGGAYAIIDGQHRATAAHLLGFKEVPAQVVIADRAQQADAFAAINGNVTKMTGQQVFHARVAAKDEVAVAVMQICVDAGVELSRRPIGVREIKPNQTNAVGAIETIYRRHGRDVLITTLQCITETANREVPGVLRAPTLTAIALVLSGHPAWLNAGGNLLDAMDDFVVDDECRAAVSEAARQKGPTVIALIAERLTAHLTERLG